VKSSDPWTFSVGAALILIRGLPGLLDTGATRNGASIRWSALRYE